MPLPTVKVVPNPYIALAHDGTPQGVVGYPGSRGYIGAQIDLKHSTDLGKTRFYYPGFPKRELEVPLDGAVAKAILDGSLIAASKECARKVGIGDKTYLDVTAALAAEKAKAEAYWASTRGADAKIGDVPTELVTSVETTTPPKAVTKKGERVLSGTAAEPHLVLGREKE